MKLTPYFKNLIWASPLYFTSLHPFIWFAEVKSIDLQMSTFLFGALGWWIALLLRLPVILYVKSKKIQSNKLVIAASGPTEEIARYIILLTIGMTFENAYSFGLGWAAIEIIYALIQVIGIGVLSQKSDDKAEEAKALMKQMGMDKTMTPSTPFWGALERLSAAGIHIGFGLLLLVNPLILIITIPVHSLINFYVVETNKKSIPKSQIGLFLMGSFIFLLGVLLH